MRGVGSGEGAQHGGQACVTPPPATPPGGTRCCLPAAAARESMGNYEDHACSLLLAYQLTRAPAAPAHPSPSTGTASNSSSHAAKGHAQGDGAAAPHDTWAVLDTPHTGWQRLQLPPPPPSGVAGAGAAHASGGGAGGLGEAGGLLSHTEWFTLEFPDEAKQVGVVWVELAIVFSKGQVGWGAHGLVVLNGCSALAGFWGASRCPAGGSGCEAAGPADGARGPAAGADVAADQDGSRQQGGAAWRWRCSGRRGRGGHGRGGGGGGAGGRAGCAWTGGWGQRKRPGGGAVLRVGGG